jgi:hypothetical protein
MAFWDETPIESARGKASGGYKELLRAAVLRGKLTICEAAGAACVGDAAAIERVCANQRAFLTALGMPPEQHPHALAASARRTAALAARIADQRIAMGASPSRSRTRALWSSSPWRASSRGWAGTWRADCKPRVSEMLPASTRGR